MTKKELETLEIIIPDGKLKGCLVYHEAIIDLINTLLKEQRDEILKKLDSEIELLEKEGTEEASYKISGLFDLRKKL